MFVPQPLFGGELDEKKDSDNDEKREIIIADDQQFDASTRTSDKLVSFGYPCNIDTTIATIKFKAYGMVKTTVLYYDSSYNDDCWNREQWIVFIKSPTVKVSETNSSYHSVQVKDLKPGMYYSFIVEVFYQKSNERTHSEPIKFRTRNEDIDLEPMQVKLKWQSSKYKAIPIMEIKNNDKKLHFKITYHSKKEYNKVIHYETNIDIDKKNLNDKLFSYTFSGNKEILCVQLYDSNKDKLKIYCCHKDRDMNKSIGVNTEIFHSYTATISTVMTFPTDWKLKYCSCHLSFADENDRYLLSLTQYNLYNYMTDKYKDIQVFDLQSNNFKRVYQTDARFGNDRVIGDANTYMMLYENRLLFYTLFDEMKQYRLIIGWNYDYCKKKQEILSDCFEFNGSKVPDMVHLVLSYLSNPWNYTLNSYVVQFNQSVQHKINHIWMDKDKPNVINVCDEYDECHCYSIVNQTKNVMV